MTKRGDLKELTRLVQAEHDEARRRARLGDLAPSFVALLTEAELLERTSAVYPFQLLSETEVRRLGFNSRRAQRVLEVNPTWTDPHFPTVPRPSPQEIWDALVDESRTTPVLVLSPTEPNALARPPVDAPRVRWIGVHEDQPYLYVHTDGARIPRRGYLRLDTPGDDALMERKRLFTNFVGEHPLTSGLLDAPGEPRSFVNNPHPREALEEAILSSHGVFPVQGPPGTGKTHLATNVVRRFLASNRHGRVLVCAKEHFALDHILRKITSALADDGVEFRAWRSLSESRRRRSPREHDNEWLAAPVTRELAERSWSHESEGWRTWQASTFDQHDRRLATLGQEAANLYFCTTMDAAMVGFIGRESFDLVIVEEAGKCYPSELLHSVGLGRTVLLIGDHRQLPPYQEKRTREAIVAWENTLVRAKTRREHEALLLQRFGATAKAMLALMREHGRLADDERAWVRPFEFIFDRSPARHRLEEQFRMEAPLSRLVGTVFYERPFRHRKGELVRDGLLDPRPLGDALPRAFDVPLVWIDTPHMVDVPNATEDDRKCGVRDNRFEHDLVLAYLRRVATGRNLDFVILTPYNAQKRLFLESSELRELCAGLTTRVFEQIVRTTDEYQGREAELTIVSLVRNNSLGARAWGFMTEPERLNVMFSRARFRQVIVGCSAHIERHAEEAERLHAAWEMYKEEARNPACARIIPAQEMLGG
ncbi:MAG: AAA family ATPase [Myxococcales bacterium]|nr:AAA family ATPase [Myxococcales bacterium]MCB9754481.1 AAA family ATPase [Myxococcales bacterium]